MVIFMAINTKMTKSTKIMIAIIAAVLSLCIIITACVSISRKNSNEPLSTTAGTSGENVSDNSLNSIEPQQTTASEPISQTEMLGSAILGKWTDSANMSGYEFFDNGFVTVTYVNLTVPVVNMPINGSAKGSYTVEGNIVTVKFSIYSKTITKTFDASISGNSLTLKDRKDGDVATYERASSASNNEPITSAGVSGAVTEQTGIIGGWANSDGNWRYTFNEDGTIRVSMNNVRIPSVSSDPFTGTYNGVYMTDDDDITIQFMANGKKITLEYEYKISGSTMSMEDSNDDVLLFVRGGGAASTNAGDLIGKWTDGSEMSGYEFKEGGKVTITYVNFTVPVVNMPINGNYEGTYSVKGNKITVNATIYSKTVTNTYTFSVQNNVLTLTEADGSVKSYIRK